MKSKKTFSQLWNETPMAVKLVAGGLVGYGLYRLIKRLTTPGEFIQPDPAPPGGIVQNTLDCSGIWNNTNLTRPKASYYADADAISTALGFGTYIVSWTEDDTLAGEILKRANNETDVYALNCAFGLRNVSLLSGDANLVYFISNYLDNDVKEAVNNNYASKGINWRW